MAIAYGVLCDEETTRANCREIIETRAYTLEKLKSLGFEVMESKANFIFIRTDKIGGAGLYEELKKRGVLVRHFTMDRIADYNRVTIGTKKQMDVFLEKVREIIS